MTETAPGPVRVAGSGTAVGAVTAAAMLVVAAALAWFGRASALYLVVVLTASAAGIVVTLVRNRHDHVVLDDVGLTVVSRSGRVMHRWKDVLEVGWLALVPVLPRSGPGCSFVRRPAGPFPSRDSTSPPALRPSPCTAAAPDAGCATRSPPPAPATASRSPRTAW